MGGRDRGGGAHTNRGLHHRADHRAEPRGLGAAQLLDGDAERPALGQLDVHEVGGV